MLKFKNTSSDRLIYYIILFILILFLATVFLTLCFDIHPPKLCTFNKYTGLYCPGCGGYRSVISMINGDFLKSLYYNIFILPSFVFSIIYAISHTISILSSNKIRAMHFYPIYAYICIFVLLTQCLIKNILLLFNIKLL